MKDSIFKNFLVNIRAFFTMNIRKSINQNASEIAALQRRCDYLNILEYFDTHELEAKTYLKELKYMRDLGCFCNIPYPQNPVLTAVISGIDSVSKLPYVVHNGKKLFFSSNYSEHEAVAKYLSYLQEERFLEQSETALIPHQYQSSFIHVEEGDVLFDIGAAEGLFALDVIEKVSRVIIVESDAAWITALYKTFEPFKNKVTIIQKYISTVDTKKTLSLKSLLVVSDSHPAFVKMDIEGYELPSIGAAMDFLSGHKGFKFSVAAYHRHHDAEELKELFDKMGYASEFSNGYMLFDQFDTPHPPFFRNGIIRAKK